jgi:prevent-host-death family protein
MKTISQRELRNESAAIMDAVERGETFRITRHGHELAELRPVPKDAFTPVAEARKVFAGLPTGDYDKMLEQAAAIFGEDRIGG